MKKSITISKRVVVLLFMLLSGVMILLFLRNCNYGTGEPLKKEMNIVSNNLESCMKCHDQYTGFSAYHDPKKIGCVSCHLGDPKTEEKELSHKGMVIIPGNLSDAERTCGKCHANELRKVQHSLMSSNSGLVAVDKFVFGEAPDPDGSYHIKDIKHTAADTHLRNLCGNCHLGSEKNELGPITQLSRGGGCNACHLNYSKEASQDLTTYLQSGKKTLPKIHPSVDIFVKNEHCYGCHSRSSRISTSYEGWHETLLETIDTSLNRNFKIIEDKRVYTYKGEDVHHQKGMLCIDCHTSHEVMGDGKKYLHQEDAVKIQCADCHFRDKPATTTYKELDGESLLVWLHRKYEHNDKPILAKQKDKAPLVNTFINEKGEAFLISKHNGKILPVKRQPDICAKDKVHADVSCATCHTQWTPKCIGCHNTFDKKEPEAYDLLDKKFVTGGWKEHVFEFGTSLPALGVRAVGKGKRIEPAVPGMIMTIDHKSFDKNKDNTFHRLYAPNSPHTIAKKSRDCKSCHANPEALGYGSGELMYVVEKNIGKWNFIPDYDKNPNDNLPEDAWVPFLKEPTNKVLTTRTNFRPLSVTEQKKMLRVGACFHCHEQNSTLAKSFLVNNFEEILKKRTKACILPAYN